MKITFNSKWLTTYQRTYTIWSSFVITILLLICSCFFSPSARGKKDKYAGPLLMGAMMVAGTLLPIKLGALALMSGKALMTSMLALMLSAILALKKLASGGGGGGGHTGATYEVINVPSHGGHGPHGRSLAHSLAYGLPVDPTVAVTTVQNSPAWTSRPDTII